MATSEAFAFLQALYQGQTDGYLTLSARHPSLKRPLPSRHLAINQPREIHAALTDLLAANAQGWGAFYSLALRRQPLGRWRRGGYAELLRLPALFADLDVTPEMGLERLALSGIPPPSAQIASGRGLHLLWFIQPTTDFAQANLCLVGLAHQLGGDKLTSAGMLRLPGSHNTKPTVHRPCQLLSLEPQRRYALTDFPRYQPPSKPIFSARPHLSGTELNPLLIQALVQTLLRDYGGFVRRSGWIASLCPGGHAHDYPGAHFGFSPRQAVGQCFGKHGRWLLKDLSSLLGLNPAHYGGLYR